MALDHVQEVCFSAEAIQEIVQNVSRLYKEQQNNSGSEKKSLEKRIESIENNINNWIEALGKGINGLENKITEAQSRLEALQFELHKMKAMDQSINISDDFIRDILKRKKHLLYSADDADKKQVLQEYVDHLVIHPCTKNMILRV
jgi:site-specific DNA recombinase